MGLAARFDALAGRYPALRGALPYARLMRLDKPIGTWLLLLPCWWGAALASHGLPSPWLLLLFGIGALLMRGAGCTVNDLYDRRLDAQVERTKNRPLASGAVQPWQAMALAAILMLLGFCILLCFNAFTVWLGVSSVTLVLIYPLMKRVTWWPQFVLGLAFNWGTLMGWSAVTGRLDPAAVILYLAGICWTLGYDTIYAHQDIRDDEAVGIKSTARLFGDRSKSFVVLFYGLSAAFLLLAGWMQHLGYGFYAGMALAAALAGWHLHAWQDFDPDDCLTRFRANRDIGLLALAGIVLGKFV